MTIFKGLMNFVYIDKHLWKILGDHAKHEYPHECIGFFEAIHTVPGSIKITNVFPGKNVIKPKNIRTMAALLSKKDEKELLQLTRRNPDKIYGMFHSHPESGMTYLGEKDSFNAKIYKRFRNQIIVGVTHHGLRTKKAYWFWVKPLWTELQIIVK